jgi:hypothetical protein
VAAVADVAAGLVGGAGLGRRLDGVGLEVADLVPVGAKSGVTRKAVILEGVLDLGPGAGQAHDLLRRKLAVALEAGGFRIDLLAQGEAVIGLRRRGRRGALRFLARVMALMAGIAAQVHQGLRHRRRQVPSMKAVLLSTVGTGALVPGDAVGGADTGRRCDARLVFQHFLVAGEALRVGRRVDGRLEMQGAVARPQQLSVEIHDTFAVGSLLGLPARPDAPRRGKDHQGDKNPFDRIFHDVSGPALPGSEWLRRTTGADRSIPAIPGD